MSITKTPIKEVVASARAIKALADAGYENVEDLEGVSLETLSQVRGVGQVTLQSLVRQLNKADVELAEEEEYGDWEEGPQPIHIDSPYDLAIRVHEAGETRIGNRVKIHNPKFLRCKNGRARLTREIYLLAKYQGDKPGAAEELKTDTPWRLDAIEWLKDKPAFKRGEFVILTD
jgi:hypothetical protein